MEGKRDTHLDVPIHESEGIREHPEELTDRCPSPVCPESLDEQGRWRWRSESGNGCNGGSGYRPFGHDMRSGPIRCDLMRLFGSLK